MYIGPWQEYKLYSSGSKPRALKRNDDKQGLKAEIEAAVLASLDAQSARKALDAMLPILESAPSIPETDIIGRNRRKIVERPALVPLLHLDEQGMGNHGSKMSLLSISSARDAIGDSSPPMSVRSVLSEPPLPLSEANNLRSNRNNKLFQSKSARDAPQFDSISSIEGRAKPSHLLPQITPGTKQPPYDAKAVAHVLKAERQSRNTKVKLAKHWGWSDGGNSKSTLFEDSTINLDLDNCSEVSREKKVKAPPNANVETKKLAQVQKMREVYLTKPEQFLIEATVPVTRPKVVEVEVKRAAPKFSSPIAEHQQQHIATQNIGDKDLTENDFHVVSKYFFVQPKSPPMPVVGRSVNQLGIHRRIVNANNTENVQNTVETMDVTIAAQSGTNAIHTPVMSNLIPTVHSDNHGMNNRREHPLNLGSNPPSRQSAGPWKPIDNDSPQSRSSRSQSPGSLFKSPLSADGSPGHGNDSLIKWSLDLNLEEF